jgi:hypothetical protein
MIEDLKLNKYKTLTHVYVGYFTSLIYYNLINFTTLLANS